MKFIVLSFLLLTACAPDTSTKYVGLQPPDYGQPPTLQGRYTSGALSVEIRPDGSVTLINGDVYNYAMHTVSIDVVNMRTGSLFLDRLTSTTNSRIVLGSNSVIFISDINSDASCVKFQLGVPAQWFCR